MLDGKTYFIIDDKHDDPGPYNFLSCENVIKALSDKNFKRIVLEEQNALIETLVNAYFDNQITQKQFQDFYTFRYPQSENQNIPHAEFFSLVDHAKTYKMSMPTVNHHEGYLSSDEYEKIERYESGLAGEIVKALRVQKDQWDGFSDQKKEGLFESVLTKFGEENPNLTAFYDSVFVTSVSAKDFAQKRAALEVFLDRKPTGDDMREYESARLIDIAVKIDEQGDPAKTESFTQAITGLDQERIKLDQNVASRIQENSLVKYGAKHALENHLKQSGQTTFVAYVAQNLLEMEKDVPNNPHDCEIEITKTKNGGIELNISYPGQPIRPVLVYSDCSL